MRVLHIGKYYPPYAGGIENFMGDLLPELKKKGITPLAIVHNHGKQDGNHPDCIDGVDIVRVRTHGSVVYAPVSPAFGPHLKRVIRRFRPDVIHAHMPNTSVFWLFMISEASGIPLVVHWHSDVVTSHIDQRLKAAYHAYKPFEKAILKKAAAVIATSEPYLDSSVPLRDFRKKTHVIPLGLDKARFRITDESAVAKAEMFWPGDGFRVLCIGRLTYYKGQDVLIKAASGLSDIYVNIVGEGELKHKLKRLIVKYGAESTVTLTGFQDEETLKGLIKTCDCLVLPSLERTEAFGLVLLEAMRFSRPVIASNVSGSGMGFVVKHGQTGLLTTPNDAASLKNALTTLLEDPAYAERMGKNGYDRFNRLFGINRIADEIIALYNRL